MTAIFLPGILLNAAILYLFGRLLEAGAGS